MQGSKVTSELGISLPGLRFLQNKDFPPRDNSPAHGRALPRPHSLPYLSGIRAALKGKLKAMGN